MSNPFLTGGHEEIETAILLEKATQCDLATLSRGYENAVAFTDGTHVFVNSDDRLAKILPAYDHKMLKWLLWHEEYHMKLKHHPRYFKFLNQLEKDIERGHVDEFTVTQEEVNIIMDILVHDSLSKMFPDLIDTAVTNLAQMRNRNSLGYTFKGKTLEDMLDEYSRYKKKDEKKDESDSDSDSDSKDKDEDKKDEDEKDSKTKKKHAKGGDEDKSPDGSTTKKDEESPEKSERPSEPEPTPEHDKTDWSKLDKIDSKEFIKKDEGDYLLGKIEDLKKKKFKLAKLTQTLNGLATTTRMRSYSVPSYLTRDNMIMKGKKPAKTALYLCFDASGSMGSQLELFKEIISKSIPHAMDVPCEWFTGHYGKGKFKDIMPVWANSGFCDDGDRVIELCRQAEEKGYSPIGVTDGGGNLYDPDNLKKLKRTILVGQNRYWLEEAQRINPRIQILDI